jgi:hypothetical protein
LELSQLIPLYKEYILIKIEKKRNVSKVTQCQRHRSISHFKHYTLSKHYTLQSSKYSSIFTELVPFTLPRVLCFFLFRQISIDLVLVLGSLDSEESLRYLMQTSQLLGAGAPIPIKCEGHVLTSKGDLVIFHYFVFNRETIVIRAHNQA